MPTRRTRPRPKTEGSCLAFPGAWVRRSWSDRPTVFGSPHSRLAHRQHEHCELRLAGLRQHHVMPPVLQTCDAAPVPVLGEPAPPGSDGAIAGPLKHSRVHRQAGSPRVADHDGGCGVRRDGNRAVGRRCRASHRLPGRSRERRGSPDRARRLPPGGSAERPTGSRAPTGTCRRPAGKPGTGRSGTVATAHGDVRINDGRYSVRSPDSHFALAHDHLTRVPTALAP
jgi:hypothetical protein